MSSKEEVDSQNSFQIEPVDLNQFFEDEGKIYGYQELKVKLQIYDLISFSISYLLYAVKASNTIILFLRSRIQGIIWLFYSQDHLLG